MAESVPTTETDCSISLIETTSPSQLQEVTLEHDGTFSNTMGLRSPSGPMRGRSVKEFEEQLTNLKKENFNLKLRIYFLEEKMGSNFTLDKDNIVKKHIELQVDYANLKKEMEEKQDLLCQAVKAMELQDEEHKKYAAEKEYQLNMYKQEQEDLRVQLQDIKNDSEATSYRTDTTGFCSSKATHSTTNELQQRIKILENEIHLEKENNASLQFVIGQTETLKIRCENMQKEMHAKEDIIKNLQNENETLSTRITANTMQMKDLQDKLDVMYKENQTLLKKMVTDNKKFEELAEQYAELKKKYSGMKADLEREHKKTERVKSANDTKVSELEEENEKLKLKYRELQSKFDAAVTEIRKNQNLAVSKSPMLKSNKSNTDCRSVSVQDPTTPTGIAEKNALHVQIASSSESTISSTSSTSLTSPSTKPEKYNVDFEELLKSSRKEKIISLFTSLRQDYETQRQKLFKLKTEQFKACEIIKNMIESRNKANDEITLYQMQIKNLEKELESVVSKPTSDGDIAPLRERAVRTNNEKSMEEMQAEGMDMAEQYKVLSVELEAKIQILEATLKEKDNQIQKIREQYDNLLTSLEYKDNKITELEFEVLSGNPDAKEKEKEIERLNSFLQEIVNKELWEKNKEIEKLHSKLMNSPEILKLKKDLTGKDQQLKVLKQTISELGLDLNVGYDAEMKDFSSSPTKINNIRTLQDELKACKEERDFLKLKIKEVEAVNYPEIIEKLKSQVESLKIDLEKSEKLKRESNKVCTLLNCRLEELTIFLDSLLKQKSILGYIGMHKERKLREIINSSLDLSKSFNMSLGFNPDQSLAQLSNITSILNGSAFKDLSLDSREVEESPEILSIVPSDITLTYQSHLYKQNKKSEPNCDEVITALREQIVNLKSELQLRDNELNKLNTITKISDTDEEQRNNNLSGYARELSKYVTPTKSNTTSTTLKYQSDCHSESEGWSEPDRAVSRARIGLNQTLTNSITSKEERFSESTEDEATCNVTPKIKTMYDKQQIIELHQQMNELQMECEQKTQQLRSTVAKELYEQVKTNLLQTEEKLLNVETLKSEAENQVVALKIQLEDLMKTKEELMRSIVNKDKEVQNLINSLEVEKTEKLNLTEELNRVIQKAKEDLVNYENKEKDFKELETRMKKVVEEFAVDIEAEHIRKLEEIEQKVTDKIELIKEEYSNNYVQRMKEIEENYSKNFIRKSEAEQKLLEVDRLISELDELKEMVDSYERTLKMYQNKEQEISNKVAEEQEKISNLRKELDATTLQYSESVLEKTKLANEKTRLEQELERYNLRDSELKQQLAEIRAECDSVSQNYQLQISTLQKQKSELQVKISVLESNNAELHNRFVRAQAHRVELSSTMPNLSTTNHNIGFQRQFSQPSYSSEDNLEECSRYNLNTSLARNRQHPDVDRQEANASPDLGIESDQGRFSSLEMHHNNTNIVRPLLQTIELTESMNNLLDGDGDTNEKIDSGEKQHCCQNTQELRNENHELKRKLLGMRRALEETAQQLTIANQRKRQVEKTICKQIHKTSQVLRQAKANLDSGSESDAFKM
ncbi:centrosomin isoform X2 [Diorhabda sublineata]|uniref:centrosomin isoform X2 n=1 Tax=Diorhabda sublineata TaxID=1163346 RepID=UPI0024E15FE4|nr:centrosomin isoform X2 [Diorhabda sublineata]